MSPVVEQSGLNWTDLVVMGIIVISTGISLLRGFFKEAISLATWIVAFWVALRFSADQTHLLESVIDTPSIRAGVSFATLFLVTLILGSMINRAMQRLIDFSGFGGMDHLLGMLFGAARGILIVSLLVLLAGLTPLPQDSWWHESLLLPHFQEIAGWLREQLPDHLRSYFSYTPLL
mgnify:CR=1 FL=1